LATDAEIPYLGFGAYLIAEGEMDRGDGVAWAMGDPTKAP
jgi:hypothetical protein